MINKFQYALIMKRLTTLMLFVCLMSGLMAQNQDERQKRFEDMKAKRAAFFTERIGLTPEEAEKFWPVYNSLQDQKGKLNDKMRTLFQKTKRNEKGERVFDYEKITDEMIRIKVQEANLEKAYHEKFKKILGAEKLFRYYHTEREWGGELLKFIQRGNGAKR
ncbi:MAG TPA: hypothetical protein DD409_01380 [Bacteroidales bacterium]|jgi:hypothetical protein|nr:MAG: hypothetical protein BWY72_01720 [Bacteroidetes bacterium ADurb.Bin416]HBL71640.1 hypothetical protein [Bacteroidales bacterium]